MNVFWVAQDNKKNGSFKQYKAEVLCTISSLLIIKHFYPEFKTIFFLDRWTKEYYDKFGVLDLFDEIDTKTLDKKSNINYEMFYAASKLVAMSTLKGPALNLDLDFFIFSDLRKLGMFDCDISCFYLEINEDYAYVQPEKGMGLVPFKWELPYDRDAFNVSLFYIRNGFFREYYCNEVIKYMEYVSQTHYNSFPKDEYFQLNLFVDQYLSHQFVKKHNQSLKVLIDDFYPIEKRHTYVSSVGVHYNDSVNHCYHFGNHKQFLNEPDFNNSKSELIFQHSRKILGKSNILQKLYETPYNDLRFKF